jgi:hypothetical protein
MDNIAEFVEKRVSAQLLLPGVGKQGGNNNPRISQRPAGSGSS